MRILRDFFRKAISKDTSKLLFLVCTGNIWDALRDLVPFVHFFKSEEHPWRSVSFSKVAGLQKVTLLHGCFSRFLNCANSTKSRRVSHIVCDVCTKLAILWVTICQHVITILWVGNSSTPKHNLLHSLIKNYERQIKNCEAV